MEKSIVYLACPYTSDDKGIVEERVRKVNIATGKLMSQGENVFSPLSHSHPIATVCDLPTTWDFWEKYDIAFIEISKKLVILKLDGWDTSTGVTAEIKIAEKLGVPIEYLEEDFINV